MINLITHVPVITLGTLTHTKKEKKKRKGKSLETLTQKKRRKEKEKKKESGKNKYGKANEYKTETQFGFRTVAALRRRSR